MAVEAPLEPAITPEPLEEEAEAASELRAVKRSCIGWLSEIEEVPEDKPDVPLLLEQQAEPEQASLMTTTPQRPFPWRKLACSISDFLDFFGQNMTFEIV
ncbi:hypothetical protein KSP39_PZI024286 [Platanthera zijinensis]|uniref:Uncharacterized protein n=1 Tax=Platanthera zijinensis TaxID=2320716 RepID=A0AAP0ATU8_9ASPA